MKVDGKFVPVLRKDLSRHIQNLMLEDNIENIYFPPLEDWKFYTEYYVNTEGFDRWLFNLQLESIQQLSEQSWSELENLGFTRRDPKPQNSEILHIVSLYIVLLPALYVMAYYILFGIFADLLRAEKRRLFVRMQFGQSRKKVRRQVFRYGALFYSVTLLLNVIMMGVVTTFKAWYIPVLINTAFFLFLFSRVWSETKWENQATALDQYQSV